MEKIYKMEGYTLHVIPSKKFKNITISLKLQTELTKENVSKRTLLSFMLVTGTKELPSTQALSSYLENLYGMKFGTSVGTKGKSHIININSICVNEEYLPYKEDLITKQIKLLNDVLVNPNVKDDKFDELMFNLKKKELKERLIAAKDDKFSYSLEKLFEYMGQNDYLGISSHGYIEEIDEITNEELYQYFKDVVANDSKHVYVVGDVDEEIIDIFRNNLSLPNNDNNYPTVYTFKTPRKDVLEIVEKQDITQSKLNIGYTIDCDFISKNHYAFTVFNAYLGGFSQSKLFKVVREEHSLCYYVSSSYDAFNGIMVVNAGIENNDYDKTIDLINQEIKKIQDGIVDDDLDIIKILLKNALTKTKDEPLSMVSLLFNRNISGKDETNDQYLQSLMEVTKEEIIEVSKQVKLDTIFFLTGGDK